MDRLDIEKKYCWRIYFFFDSGVWKKIKVETRTRFRVYGLRFRSGNKKSLKNISITHMTTPKSRNSPELSSPSSSDDDDDSLDLTQLASSLKRNDPRFKVTRKRPGDITIPSSSSSSSSANELNKFDSPIPRCASRTLPNVDYTDLMKPRQKKYQSVVSFMVQNMDSVDSVMKVLPFQKPRETHPKPEIPIEPLTEEDQKAYQELVNQQIETQRQILRNVDVDSDTEPLSPGADQQIEYVPAEFGVPKPRFSAAAHVKMFRDSNLTEDKMERIIKSTRGTEMSLRKQYDDICRGESVRRIMKGTAKKLKKRYRDQYKRDLQLKRQKQQQSQPVCAPHQ